MSNNFENLWLVWVAGGVVVFLLAYMVRTAAKDVADKRRGSEQLEETDRVIDSDPYLARELGRLNELIDELDGSYIGDKSSMSDMRALAIQRDYNEIDDRFFDLYEKNIAQMSKSELYAELREIEQMLIEHKAKVAQITELAAEFESEEVH